MRHFCLTRTMTLRRLFFESVPVVISLFVWPLILLAEKNEIVCKLYYWFLFTYSKYLFHDTQEIIKRRMFRDLHAYRASISEDVSILEVGPGDGENFAHYPRRSRITTVEYNSFLEQRFSELVKKHPTLVLEKSLLGSVEDMKEVPSESFDVVVGTHILCCVNNPEKALREINRVLRTVSTA